MSSELQVVADDEHTGHVPDLTLDDLGVVPAPADAPITPLGALLVERGDLSGQQLRDALGSQTSGGKRLGEILVELGVISDRALSSALAEQVGLDAVDIARARPDVAIVGLLTEEQARELRVLPLRRSGGRIEVAIADPLNTQLQAKLIALLHAPVRLLVAPPDDIEYAIDRAYLNQNEISGALKEFAQRSEERGRLTKTTGSDVAVDENAPIVKVVNLIFEQAVRDRGSDVHIEPQQDRVRVRVRTDGALHEVLSLPVSMATPLVSRIKVMADMNIVERRKPQDGQIEITIEGHDLDVRVSTTATVFGEKCVMRLLDRTRALFSLAELGMSPESYAEYERLIKSPYGMVICAGPTGAGKTTTLYATLAEIDREEINIMTIEDPVEYVFPSINQIQINPLAGVTFATGLRSILRQDPDAILVGEIRDVDTARIAVQAAMTGHFVMSSLHATDSTSALHRFMDMGIEPFLVASSLLGIVGQRLIRKICTHCVASYTPSAEERAFYDLSHGRSDKIDFKHGRGCNQCGQTGYFDRIGIYEVLPVTDALKDLIVARASLADLREAAAAAGMRTLSDQAIDLVEADVTTIAEVLRTVYVLKVGIIMSRFTYTAVAADGTKVKDELDAISESLARDELLGRNLEVQKLKRARKSILSVNITKQRVKRVEIMNFSRQMAAFVAAGIPLTEGLQVIARSSSNEHWQEVLGEAAEAITQGAQFSDALARHADLFPPYYLGIVKAAEMTGRLDLALVQVSNYLERDLETRSSINQALAYPMVVLGMAGVTVSVLAVWVLPKFATFFSGLGAKLPLSTRLLIGAANITKHDWWMFLVAFALFGGSLGAAWKTEKGRRFRNRVTLKLPLIKVIVMYSVVERVTRILGAMSRAGVPLPDAMAAAIQGANNSVFEEGLQSAQVRMLEGEGLAGPIGDTGLFPEGAIQMMRVGENTGTLDVQLENASEYYAKELSYKLKKLTTFFEPAVILVMGLVVGFVAIALVQAMYGIYSAPNMSGIK